MKILHTADWHLGIKLHGRSLEEDHAHMIDEFSRLIKEHKPDVFIIAGDVFDVANPPRQSLRLLSAALNCIANEHKVKTLIISGNHDDADRLGWPGELLSDNIHLNTDLLEGTKPLNLEVNGVEVQFFLLPFFTTQEVSRVFEVPDFTDKSAAMTYIVERIKQNWDDSKPHVLIAHDFVWEQAQEEAGRTDLESVLVEQDVESPIQHVGGLDVLSPELLKDFDYVALGHIHNARREIGSTKIRYSGSPFKYSFPTTAHSHAALDKSCWLVELDATGAIVSDKQLSIVPLRDYIVVEKTLQDVLAIRLTEDEQRHFYYVILKPDGEKKYSGHIKSELRKVFDNLVRWRWQDSLDNQWQFGDDTNGVTRGPSLRGKTDHEIVSVFLQRFWPTGEEMPDGINKIIEAMLSRRED